MPHDIVAFTIERPSNCPLQGTLTAFAPLSGTTLDCLLSEDETFHA